MAKIAMHTAERTEMKEWCAKYIESQEKYKKRDEARFGFSESEHTDIDPATLNLERDPRIKLLADRNALFIARESNKPLAAC